MFKDLDMDNRGEVPAPFCVEKFNFNPHNLMGDFDYIENQPRMMVTNKGFFVDKKGRRVNKFGWMVLTNQGHLMDKHGRKKLDKRQLTAEGDIPKLFNLSGKRYDVKDVMGQFEKDQVGNIIPHTSKNGKDLLDNLGRKVNEKGYLIDPKGNIIDSNGKQLFTQQSLKGGEFIKIFPFTKFISSTNSELFAALKSVFVILDALPAQSSLSHAAIRASHVDFPVSWLEELNGSSYRLLLLLFGFLLGQNLISFVIVF